MDPIAILGAVNTGIKLLDLAIQAGKDIGPVVALMKKTFVDKDEVTQEELDAFAAESDRLSDELMAPLPNEE